MALARANPTPFLISEEILRALLQRVRKAKVTVDEEIVGQIGPGLLVFLGCGQDDGEKELEYLVEKIINLRIFADEQGRMNRSLLDTGGQLLLVSQFTLYGDTRRGRRPSFAKAMNPADAEILYERFADRLRQAGVDVATGRFGAMMDVELLNDGPVTIWIDTAD